MNVDVDVDVVEGEEKTKKKTKVLALSDMLKVRSLAQFCDETRLHDAILSTSVSP